MFFKNSKLIMILMVTSLLFIISACSGGTQSSEETGNQDPVDPDAYRDDSGVEREGTVLLSEVLAIPEYWMSVGTNKEGAVTKDSNVSGLYTFENGNASYYPNTGKESISMLEVVDLSDADIIAHYVTEYDADDDTFDRHYLDEPYELYMDTDDSGNITERMLLGLQETIGHSDSNKISFDIPYFTNIRDQYFDGYREEDENNAIIKRVDEDDIGLIEYDSPDSELDNLYFYSDYYN